MSQNNDSHDKFSALRSRAEELVARNTSDTEDIARLSPAQVQLLVHDLRVHQIELETQNEDLRQAQCELEELKDRYLDLYDFAPVGYLTLNEKGQILEANLTSVQHLGVERQRLTKMFFSRFVSQDFVAAFHLHLRQIFETQSKQNCELKLVREDGTQFYAQLESLAVQDESGQGKRFRTALSDITDRKKIEESLRDSEEKYRLIFSMERDAITLIDGATNQFIEVNDAAAQLWGYAKEELVGMKALELSAEPELSGPSLLEATRKGGVHVPLRWHKKKDGTIFPVEISAGPVTWKGKALLCGLVRCISERMKVEELALQAARLKSVADLSSGVAHHFNNLLQMMMGGASLALDDLESGDLDEAKSYLKKMLWMAKRGAETVERLQTFAGARADATVREQLSFDVAATVRNVVELSKPLWMADAEKRGTKIDLHLDLKEGCLINGQEAEISEVTINLLRNSAEAMPQGGEIEIATFKDCDHVVISVRDTGVGIPEGDLPHIFQPFMTTKGFELGKGMGLAVAHGLVRRNGGDISAESKMGKGSTFTIRFPLVHEQVAKTIEPEFAYAARPLTILVIDDESFVAELIQRICANAGHKVFVAFSGSEALTVFEKEKVDLVICDLGMPGMSGWEVGKAVRSICEKKGVAKPPFVLLTGWGGQEWEKQKIEESGTDRVLAKPISPAVLAAAIQDIAARFNLQPPI